MEKLKSKAEDLASSLTNAQFDLRARENLLLEIFYELGSLPMLPNNGLNISEVLGVEVIKFDQRKQLTIKMDLEWIKRFENYVCALIKINNESDFPGFVKCAIDKFKTVNNNSGFIDLKYFFLPDNNEGSQSYINAKTLRQLLIAIPIEYFQDSNSNCILIIDWIVFSPDILHELKFVPQIHARIDTKFSQKFAPLNYTFNIFYPHNDGWPFSKCIESALERDAINILFCICLTKSQKYLNYSSNDLNSLFEHSLNKNFKLIDFGLWQIAFGNEFSIWSNILIYIAPDDNSERFLPKFSIIFGGNDFEVNNFYKYLTEELYSVST